MFLPRRLDLFGCKPSACVVQIGETAIPAPIHLLTSDVGGARYSLAHPLPVRYLSSWAWLTMLAVRTSARNESLAGPRPSCRTLKGRTRGFTIETGKLTQPAALSFLRGGGRDQVLE